MDAGDDHPEDPLLRGIYYLRSKRQDEFISWFPAANVDESELDKSYLQIAIEEHLLDTVRFLIAIDPNKVGRKDHTHPFAFAARRGYHQVVELFLRSSNNLTKAPLVVLIDLIQRNTRRSYNFNPNDTEQNHQRTYDLLLNHPELRVNEKSDSGTYLLHAAAAHGGDLLRQVLAKKPSLANRDGRNRLAIEAIDGDVLEEHFDACIEELPNDDAASSSDLQFDYSTLLPSSSDAEPARCVKESDVVLHLSKSRKLKRLLQHPVVESFLHLKWHQVSNFLVANVVTYLSFCASLLWFVVSNCNRPSEVVVDAPYVLLFVTALLITLREIFQIFSMPKIYVKNMENYIELALLFIVFFCLLHRPDEEERRPWFAFAVLLASLELLFLLGSIPGMSTYIVMLRTVSFNFVKFLLFNAILLLAFAFSFYILLGKQPSPATMQQAAANKTKNEDFANVHLAFFRTLVMLTGEFEAGEIDFDQFPVSSRAFFVVFVVLVAVILLNLLNGLAVSDIGLIKNEAKLIALAARAQYVSYIEAMAFDNVLIAGGWSAWLQQQVCIEKDYLLVSTSAEGLGDRTTRCAWPRGGHRLNECTINAAKSILARPQAAKIEKLFEEIKKLAEEMSALRRHVTSER